ncbi:MAG: hypothetical protein KatS3mg079_225 [Caloramator sp.]|nr:MAG: hypothetical protein KatS3mg079_225 [Caloramator sp.]
MKKKGLFITLIVIAVFVFSIFALKRGAQKAYIEVKTQPKVEEGRYCCEFFKQRSSRVKK